jgi:hypothetical protein
MWLYADLIYHLPDFEQMNYLTLHYYTKTNCRHPMKNKLLLALISLCCVLFIASCQKEVSPGGSQPTPTDPTLPPPNTVDDSTQVIASVNGVILDENELPLTGATVRCGNRTTTTNTMGIFFFRNIPVSKNNGSVSVSMNGYFNGTRNFLTVANKSHYLRIKLIRKSLSATIASATGGTVTISGGAAIIFPANALAYPNGAPYTGNVLVYATYLDPQDPKLLLTVPGDLRGIRANGSECLLTTYGMIGAELYDAGGQKLVIAGGKKVRLEFPIPAGVRPAAADSIPLWHFNESRARWLEEGVAFKEGGKMKADVSKFSFWNVDLSAGFVRFSCVIMNSIDSTPVGNQLVVLSIPGTSLFCYGYTASTGFLTTGVPVNQPVTMTVEITRACGTVLHTRNIGPFTNPVNMDTIWITGPGSGYTVFKGNIRNCQGNVASNSYISLHVPSVGTYIFEADSVTGAFSVPVYTCQSTGLSYSYQVTQFGTNQQSPIVSGTTTASLVNLGNLYACPTQPATTPDVYVFGDEKAVAGKQVIKFWKNGVATNVTDGTADCYLYDAKMNAANDQYLVGLEWNAAGTTNFAMLWINGVKTDVSGTTLANSTPYGVFVNGNDVYVCYAQQNLITGYTTARLWKNGTRTVIADSAVNFTPRSVFVTGADVYVGGSYTPRSSTVSRAVIWKNGAAQYLNAGLTSSQVNKIVVVGTDVYAVGQERLGGSGTGRAVIWKNGVPTYLTDGVSSDAMANDIFIDGSDIYVCGRRALTGAGEKAMLWKNGVATTLTPAGSNGIAKNVFVKNGDVYVTEVSFLSGPLRLYKNNIPTLLTTGANFNGVGPVIVQ